MRRERAAYVSYLAFRGPVCPIGLSFSLESFVLVFFFVWLCLIGLLGSSVSYWPYVFLSVLLALRFLPCFFCVTGQFLFCCVLLAFQVLPCFIGPTCSFLSD